MPDDSRNWFQRNFIDPFVRAFASGIEDIRRTVVETGWFGKPVTGRSTTISVEAPKDQSFSTQLGWTFSDELDRSTQRSNHDHAHAPKEPQGPERGIDL